MPPWHGGGEMIKSVTFEKTIYNDLPFKFEAGTPNIADGIALGAAIDYINEIGLQNIHEYENELLHHGQSDPRSAVRSIRTSFVPEVFRPRSFAGEFH